MTLDTLEIGKDAIVSSVDCEEKSLRQHIFDMGLTPGTEVTMVKYAPMGDPLEIRLRGYELTIRAADAAQISLENVHDAHEKVRLQVASGVTSHPAIGESKLRPRAAGGVVPAGKPLSFALAGNQNCGKTTLFNQLTGSNQHVGNFPGVTVDRKDGQMRSHPEATVTDLPGIYSLSPYTGEEVVSRQFIIDSKPDAIIDIVDATNIERNLYLTTQLMELDVPMVIALNMMDEVTENGGSVDVNALESFLGVPVVPISAAKDEGVDELVEHAIHVARYRERLGDVDGLQLNPVQKDVKPNYAYFPVIFDEKIFGATRNEVMEALAAHDIGARKYFCPLTNTFECFHNMFDVNETPVALHMSRHVLTLPLYADLQIEDVDRICDIVLSLKK